MNLGMKLITQKELSTSPLVNQDDSVLSQSENETPTLLEGRRGKL